MSTEKRAKKRVLIQFDPDENASTFDSIVAIDSGVDHLLTQADVSPIEIQALVHGAIFTRGGDDLKSTALFFGGSDVKQCDALVRAAKKAFFGPMRVSLMSDPNGCNTTAAAAVLSAQKHVDFEGKTVTVLAATGPVGIRIGQLIAKLGATTRLCSRSGERAAEACDSIRAVYPTANVLPFATETEGKALASIKGADVVFSAGAAGVELLGAPWLDLDNRPQVVVDINAVPPLGIHGVAVTDQGEDRNGTICYGAIGVGGLKMKIHKRCIKRLFESNDAVLEVNEIFEEGQHCQ